MKTKIRLFQLFAEFLDLYVSMALLAKFDR